MMNATKHGLLIGLTVALAASATALAQAPGARARLRGQIDAVVGDTLQLTLRDGGKVTAQVGPETRVTWIVATEVSQIKQGSYVGTAAVAQPDGTLRALEVQVFPPEMRGVGEGSQPWDLGAGSSMTNGTVGSLVMAQGRTLTITYKGGEQRVVVPDGVPIVTYEPANRSVLAAGENVLVSASRGSDGTLTALSISVGQNGLVPPM